MFAIRFDTAGLRQAVGAARTDLRTEVPRLMELCGVQLLSDNQLAFEEKSRGGVGEDRVRWAPLKQSTLAARVRRRGRGRTIVQRRKRLAEQIRQTTGKGAAAKVARLRKQRADLSKELERLIDAEVSNYQIGIDTGLLRSSARPGFQGPDGAGGNVLRVEGNRVTVGYGRKYAEDFDRRRSLVPQTLPKRWRERVEAVAEDWAVQILRRRLL